jgi:dTDP-4-dehydrorhamnose reductase
MFGMTKLAGEKACLKIKFNYNPRLLALFQFLALIFCKTMSGMMQERATLSVVNDQIGVNLRMICEPSWLYSHMSNGMLVFIIFFK